MAQRASREFTELSVEVREEISSALIVLIDSLNPLIQTLFREGHGSECRAATFSTEKYEVRSQGENPMNGAIRSILFSVLAGMDHVRMFAVGLGSERPAFGLATLTRGAMEAYARAWWFLRAEDGVALLTRWLSSTSKELSMAIHINPDVELFELRGQGTTAQSLQQTVLDDFERLTGTRKPLAVSYTTLTTALVRTFNKGARSHYSHLSAVAHGETLGIQGFFGADDNRGVLILGLPDYWGVNYAEQVFMSTSTVFRELLDFMGYTKRGDEPWVLAHDDVRAILLREHARVFGEVPKTHDLNF